MTTWAALDILHQRLGEHAAAAQITDYYTVNFAIHEAIITLADNCWLAQVIGDLRKVLKLARLQQLHAPGRLEQSLAEHSAVMAALKARDADGATWQCAPTSPASAPRCASWRGCRKAGPSA